MTIKVACHPKKAYKKAINGGAIIEPKDAPALKMPCARARSLIGNHSAFALVAPGQLPASPSPSIALKIANEVTLAATACRAIETDHTTMDNKKPKRVPIASNILPNRD